MTDMTTQYTSDFDKEAKMICEYATMIQYIKQVECLIDSGVICEDLQDRVEKFLSMAKQFESQIIVKKDRNAYDMIKQEFMKMRATKFQFENSKFFQYSIGLKFYGCWSWDDFWFDVLYMQIKALIGMDNVRKYIGDKRCVKFTLDTWLSQIKMKKVRVDIEDKIKKNRFLKNGIGLYIQPFKYTGPQLME